MKKVAAVHEYKLKNGLKLIVKEDNRSPIAIFQIIYKVGSGYETNGMTGVSHALEHMMFRGTHSFSMEKFTQTIAQCGGEQNALTSYDFTAYHELLPINRIEAAFQFESDRIINLLLRKSDFVKEMQVVIEERRLKTDDNPQNFTLERFNALAHITSPYHHPIIGWMHDLVSMTIEDLRSWYNTWYVPNNAIIVIVGDVVPNQMLRLTKKYFGKIKASKLPTIKPQNEIHPLGMRSAIVKIAAELPYIIFGYNAPVWLTAQEKSHVYALLILCEILAGDKSSRFQKNLLRKQQLIIDVNYMYNPFMRLDTLINFTVTPNPEHSLDKIKIAVLNEIKIIQDEAPKNHELQRVKVQMLADEVYQQDSIPHQALEIGAFEAVGLSWKLIKKSYEAIQKVTPEEVQAVARQYLTVDRLTLVTLDPITGK